MAVRVSGAEVKEIMDTDLTDSELDPFITTANALVNDRLQGKLGTELLTQVELYLAAHFASLKDQRIQQESQGNVSTTFQGKTGMGLNFTHYGQMALSLDSSGTLAKLGKRKASLTFMESNHGRHYEH